MAVEIDVKASSTLGPMFLVAAIVLISWHGGVVPGLIAVVGASLFADFFLVMPRYTFRIDPGELPWFISFVCSGIIGMLVSTQRKRNEDQIKSARDTLEQRVTERTQALQASMEDQQKAEEQSRRAQEELARVVRLTTMGELTASIAHEINQPLTAVISNADACLRWLSAENPNLAEAKDSARRIVRDANRAADVMKTVRAMVTKAAPQIVSLSMNAAITDALTLVDREIKRHNARVHLDLAPDLPLVSVDCIQIQQVILNLLLNALDAMNTVAADACHIWISTEAAPSGFVTVAIQDSGEGVSPHIADRIFSAFFTTRPQGMGMGLAICHSIVENNGGRLWTVPAQNGGAVFKFSLPVPLLNSGCQSPSSYTGGDR